YGVEYKCGERFTVYRCRSDDQSRDAFPVQPQDDYCTVEYPDRPSNPGYVYQGTELRGELIKKLQACGALKAPSSTTSRIPQPTPSQATQTQSASSYLAEGQKYHQAKDDAKALQSFQKALKAGGPPATMARVNLEIGKVYAEQNQDTKALPWLREASRLDPNLGDARAYLGVSYYLLGKYPEALTELQEAVRLRPSDYISYDWMAATYVA
ncbi:MAG TPA: tetratricopeptide repeat protein, partial [Terriglobales bacterium]|nr:tetratricopeptide repeat protein [Terriglobales bacterium]